MIPVSCSCGAQFTAPPNLFGQQVACLTCGGPLIVGGAQQHTSLEQSESASHHSPPWTRWLAECQQRFGQPPRHFDTDTQQYLAIESAWVYGLLFWVPLCKLLKQGRQKSIFRHGHVVWGHVIQANGVLWEPSQLAGPSDEESDDAPGELVFSTDTSGNISPDHLMPIAEAVGNLRGRSGLDDECQRIGNYLEAETVRVFGWNVPQRLSPRISTYISTTMFLRKHLPDGYLRREFLPIVISHKPPYYAMPLPAKFWSPDLIRWWTNS